MVPSNAGGRGTDPDLPDDVVADLLDVERRRRALEVLSRQETAMVIDDLAAAVRARETETSPDAIESEERQRVRDELFQRHLPKLTATDVVRYDSMLGTVQLADTESVVDALENG